MIPVVPIPAVTSVAKTLLLTPAVMPDINVAPTDSIST